MNFFGLTDEQYNDALRIDKMAAGSQRVAEEEAWCKKHGKEWPCLIYYHSKKLAAIYYSFTKGGVTCCQGD